MIQHLSVKEIEEKIDAGETVVIDFWAAWCGPCRNFGPIFEKVSGEVENATFVKVNVDDENEFATLKQIRSIPAVHVYKDGALKASEVGILEPAHLKSLI